MKKALPWAFLAAIVIGAVTSGRDGMFAISFYLLIAAVVTDFWIGPAMKRRGLFQLVVCILFFVVLANMPRCSTSDGLIDETGLSDTSDSYR